MYNQKGDNDSALFYFQNGLNYLTFARDTLGIGAAYVGLSNTYRNLGDYTNSVKTGLEAEKIFIAANNNSGLTRTYNSIGLAFKQQKDYEKTMYYYLKCLDISILNNDEKIMAGIYSNIAGVHLEQHNYDSGNYYNHKALQLRIKNNDVQGMAISYGNFGITFLDLGQLDSAEYYINLALEKMQQVNYGYGLGLSYSSLGKITQAKNNHADAIMWFKKAEKYFQDGNFLGELSTLSVSIAKSYEAVGNYKESTRYLKQHIEFKDSLFNDEKLKESQRYELEFRFKEKQLADSLKIVERDKIAAIEAEKHQQIEEEKLAKQKLYTYAGVAGLGLCLIIVIITLRNNKKQRVFTQVIADQKATVEEKNKEITDSITYAKRIQEAILPPQKLVEKHFPNSFIYYQPKDIVAGDFYWLAQSEHLIYFVVADCTGHGVPGAMVSVVCSNALNQTIKEFGDLAPGIILDKVRDSVIGTFEKSEEEVKDGMDISFCIFDLKNNLLKWAGANNPLWIVKSDNSIVTLSPDRQPIGKYAHATAFTSHEIQLEKGDTIYLFTDGFVDQFGGEKGKKYKAANLQKTILKINPLGLHEQHDALKNSFNTWKGDLEQVDDVCIVGIRF